MAGRRLLGPTVRGRKAGAWRKASGSLEEGIGGLAPSPLWEKVPVPMPML